MSEPQKPKRYLLFEVARHDTAGGWDDLHSTYATLPELLAGAQICPVEQALTLHCLRSELRGYLHAVDLETGEYFTEQQLVEVYRTLHGIPAECLSAEGERQVAEEKLQAQEGWARLQQEAIERQRAEAQSREEFQTMLLAMRVRRRMDDEQAAAAL